MSKVQQHHQTAIRRVDPDDNPMAICSVGIRHHGTIPDSSATTKVLIAGIDYFTKWVEAEALATIAEKNVRSFV